MVWPRVDGLRTLELGSPGEMRARLNGLVLAGRKRATAGVLTEDYEREDEPLEHLGERLVLVDDDGVQVAVLEVTDVDVARFADVPWEFAAAEGEGHADLDAWRSGHQRFWARQGVVVDDDTMIVMVRFALT